MTVCNLTSEWSELGIESDETLANVGLFRCYSEALLQFASACCVIFMLIGIPGNLTTIVALARCKKVRNATAIFIISLHTSNLIFNCFILPLSTITFVKGHWTHGWVMCRLYAYIKYVLKSSAIFAVLAITINRYVIVCHPLLYPKLYKKSNISISILMIWTSALVIFMAPNFGAWGRYGLESNGGFCTIMPDENGSSPKKFLVTIAFVVPCFTISFCYARIWWVVKTAKKVRVKNRVTQLTHLPLSQTPLNISSDENTRFSCNPSSLRSFSTIDSDKTPPSSDTSAPQSPREDKALEKYFKVPFRLTRKLVRRKVPTNRDKRLYAMIAAIMISFCISQLPVMAAKLAYKQFKSGPILNVFAQLLEYSGTCINPIIYVLMSKEYRQAYQSLYEAIIKKVQKLKISSSQ